MNKLIAEKAIQKEKNSILILDEGRLNELAIHVNEFNRSRDSRIKFEI